MEKLETTSEQIRADLAARNQARDGALQSSRELIRLCANSIRAAHREEWEKANSLLEQAGTVATELVAALQPYSELLYAGYTQDSLKEFAEAHLTLALMTDAPLPPPEDLGMDSAAYLNGLCEAASELRRRCLNLLRSSRTKDAEQMLNQMDTIYDMLVTFDFPDAVTGGLRRRVDQLRGVLERTRGDVTQALRQDRLIVSLNRFEERMQSAGDD